MNQRNRPKALVIDDDQHVLEQMPDILDGVCSVDVASSIDEGMAKLQETFFDVVLLDLNFENDSRNGLDAFRMIQALDRGLDVIVISGETNPRRLIEVFNYGASKFIPKPASVQDIRVEVKQVLNERERRAQVLNYQRKEGTNAPLNPLLGDSIAIRKLREQVSLIVESDVKDIMIQGETGTGKEVLAEFISYQMGNNRKLVSLNCGAIAENLVESELFGYVKGAFSGAEADRIGLFEAAEGGFVFLDEIGEMPLNQQTKLLRVIQERTILPVGSSTQKKINFRLISATNLELENAVSTKMFREDLYYRISKNVLVIPPLRDRLDDIEIIIANFQFKKNGKTISFSEEAIEVLKNYDWPGNIRQLHATVERIMRCSAHPIIRQADVFKAAPEFAIKTKALKGLVGTYGSTLIVNEKKRFLLALQQSRGNREDAAKILGLSRATFFRRIKDLGINKRIDI